MTVEKWLPRGPSWLLSTRLRRLGVAPGSAGAGEPFGVFVISGLFPHNCQARAGA